MNLTADTDDREQVARIAEWKARRDFDPAKGFQEEAFVGIRVRQALIDYHRKEHGRGSRPKMLPLEEDAFPVEEDRVDFLEIERVREVVARLPERLRDLLTLRLAGVEAASVARIFGVDISRVWQLQKRAWAAVAVEWAKQGLDSDNPAA